MPVIPPRDSDFFTLFPVEKPTEEPSPSPTPSHVPTGQPPIPLIPHSVEIIQSSMQTMVMMGVIVVMLTRLQVELQLGIEHCMGVLVIYFDVMGRMVVFRGF